MIEHRDQHFNSQRGSHTAESRTRHCALLVQCAVSKGVAGSNTVIAEVAAKTSSIDIIIVNVLPQSMSQHHKGLKAQGNSHAYLIMNQGLYGWEPSALP